MKYFFTVFFSFSLCSKQDLDEMLNLMENVSNK